MKEKTYSEWCVRNSVEFLAPLEVAQWCESIATLCVDALLEAELVKKDDFQTAVGIAAEEVLAHLGLQDYPPPMEPKAVA